MKNLIPSALCALFVFAMATGARAADIWMACRDDDVTVLGDVDLRAGFTAGVEPEAGSNTPAPQHAVSIAERGGVMG